MHVRARARARARVCVCVGGGGGWGCVCACVWFLFFSFFFNVKSLQRIRSMFNTESLKKGLQLLVNVYNFKLLDTVGSLS